MEKIPLPPSSPMPGVIEMLPKPVIAEEEGRTNRTVSPLTGVLIISRSAIATLVFVIRKTGK